MFLTGSAARRGSKTAARVHATALHVHVPGAASELQALWFAAAQVREGIVPNEHGTWQYGRNGWCDGQQVRLCHA